MGCVRLRGRTCRSSCLESRSFGWRCRRDHQSAKLPQNCRVGGTLRTTETFLGNSCGYLHVVTKKRSQRCTDLIGDRYSRDAYLARRKPPYPGRRTVMTKWPSVRPWTLHPQLDLWAWEPHAIDTPSPTPEEDPSVVFELHHGFVGRAGLVNDTI